MPPQDVVTDSAIDIVVAQSTHHLIIAVARKNDVGSIVRAQGTAAVDNIHRAVGVDTFIHTPGPAL